VAVKVLRPHVEEIVAIDLDISFRLLLILNITFRNHHIRALTSAIREFSVRVREEMDFRQEAAHMARFHKHFDGDRRVRAPIVYESMIRRRVLVMEWVDGDKVDQLKPRFDRGDLDHRTPWRRKVPAWPNVNRFPLDHVQCSNRSHGGAIKNHACPDVRSRRCPGSGMQDPGAPPRLRHTRRVRGGRRSI
jgi:hypothetical protein